MITNQGGSCNTGTATDRFIFDTTFIGSYKNLIGFIQLLNKIYIDAIFFKLAGITDLAAFFKNIKGGKLGNQFYIMRRPGIHQKIAVMAYDNINIVHFL